MWNFPRLRGLHPRKQPGWLEWRGNGLSTFNNYHHDTLRMAFYAHSKWFLHRAAQDVDVQQSAAQIMDKHTHTQHKSCSMRNRAEKLNCPGLFSPWLQNTTTRQEIDNVIAYFGAYFGQFVMFWQHTLSLWIVLLSIQKKTKNMALSWQEWIFLGQARKWKTSV